MAPITDSKSRRPVRVCFMIDSLQPAGTETQLLALIRHLDRSRVRPFLCLLDGEDELSRSLEPKDCPVLRLGVKGLSRPQSLAKAWRLAQFLNRQRIDVLQAYFPDSTYFGVPVAWLARVPRIVCTRNNIGYWTTPWHRRLGRLCHRLSAGLVAATHPHVTFHIAGEGELRRTLEELVADLKLTDRVFLPGTIQDVPGFLAKLDIAVLCSRSEGMSNAILEYMAAEKAIVATAVGGNGQLLEHERHGLLIPPGDPYQLGEAMRRLLNDPALAFRLAQAARKRVEERYSRQAMVRRFEAFYQDLLWGTDFPAGSTLTLLRPSLQHG